MSDLRQLRTIADFSLDELSQRANVSRLRLWRSEHGYTALTAEEQEAINRALAGPLAKAAAALLEYQRSRMTA